MATFLQQILSRQSEGANTDAARSPGLIVSPRPHINFYQTERPQIADEFQENVVSGEHSRGEEPNLNFRPYQKDTLSRAVPPSTLFSEGGAFGEGETFGREPRQAENVRAYKPETTKHSVTSERKKQQFNPDVGIQPLNVSAKRQPVIKEEGPGFLGGVLSAEKTRSNSKDFNAASLNTGFLDAPKLKGTTETGQSVEARSIRHQFINNLNQINQQTNQYRTEFNSIKEETSINITIGKIEVKARSAQVDAKPAQEKPKNRLMQLDMYLKQRDGKS